MVHVDVPLDPAVAEHLDPGYVDERTHLNRWPPRHHLDDVVMGDDPGQDRVGSRRRPGQFRSGHDLRQRAVEVEEDPSGM
jgi:hypothetical protein